VGVVTKLDEVASDKDTLKAALDLLQGQGAAMASGYPWVAVMGQPKGTSRPTRPWTRPGRRRSRRWGSLCGAAGTRGSDVSMGRDALLRILARTVRQKMKEKIPRIMAG